MALNICYYKSMTVNKQRKNNSHKIKLAITMKLQFTSSIYIIIMVWVTLMVLVTTIVHINN